MLFVMGTCMFSEENLFTEMVCEEMGVGGGGVGV